MTSLEDGVAQWHEPVYVQVGMQAPQIIRDPAEALAFLANDWMGSRRKHEFAREICTAATLRHVSSESAREAFVAAVTEARINACAPGTGV